MTQKQATSETLSPYWQEKMAVAQEMLSAVTAANVEIAQRVWPDQQQPTITPLEVHQAAMQRHIARGGNPTDHLTQSDYSEAMDALKSASIAIRHQGVKARIGLSVGEHLKLLSPLLTPEELRARRITFWRAVRITTGNHDRPNERPNRWIPIFRRKASELAAEILKVLVGQSVAEQFKRIPKSGETVWHKYEEKDLLTLHEFARMHMSCYLSHPRGVAAFAALKKKAENSSKKSLVAPGGQPDKPPRRKAKKSRTKSA